jgi:hypothetical protein
MTASRNVRQLHRGVARQRAGPRSAIAKRVSPTTYVRKGLPPIMIIHGTA